MDQRMQGDTPLSMPIDGIPWSWRPLRAPELSTLLPFVLAVDPTGTEAARWPTDAVQWLTEQPARRGLVSIECLAGLTLGLFFFGLAEEARGMRRLLVERLRWLELTRPHRSLDALLAILIDTARRHDCRDILIKPQAASPSPAHDALHSRAAAAGFAFEPRGWHRPIHD